MVKGWRQRAAWALGASLVTALLALVFVNLSPADRKIEYALPHHYVTGDSQFVRVMSSLLGPAIVDDLWVSVGSTNFDDRSFRLNDEANVNVMDAEFGAAQARQFAADRARSHLVTLEEWQHRPLKERLQERFARLLAPQL